MRQDDTPPDLAQGLPVMIAATAQLRDLDIALLILLAIIAMFIPEIVSGFRTYRRGSDLARQISREHEAREFLDRDWRERHEL